MKVEKAAQLLQIYVGSSDVWQGQPVGMAIVQRAKESGLAGASVFHGQAGYGAHSQVHTASLVDLALDLPLKIDIVDTEERIQWFLAELGDLLTEATVVVSPCHAIRYLKDPAG